MEQRELLNPEDLEKPTVAASRSRSGRVSLFKISESAALYCRPMKRSRKMLLKFFIEVGAGPKASRPEFWPSVLAAKDLFVS